MKQWTRDDVVERVGPSLWFALLPLPTVFLSFPVLLLLQEDASTVIVQGVMALAWCLVLLASVRGLRRHWAGSARQPTWSLSSAACVALLCWFALMYLGAPWQELMSEPYPTPTMVLKDILANFGPFLVSAGAACVVLVASRRERPSGA